MIATTIEQSKHLLELGLSPETADMYYVNSDTNKIIIRKWKDEIHDEDDIPCWSLSAMLELMPKYIIQKNGINADLVVRAHGQQWNIGYYCIEVKYSEDIVDTAYLLLCWSLRTTTLNKTNYEKHF